MKEILQADSTKERFKEMMIAANPSTQEEAQALSERIKKQIIEEAKRNVLTGGSSKKKRLTLSSRTGLKFRRRNK